MLLTLSVCNIVRSGEVLVSKESRRDLIIARKANYIRVLIKRIAVVLLIVFICGPLLTYFFIYRPLGNSVKENLLLNFSQLSEVKYNSFNHEINQNLSKAKLISDRAMIRRSMQSYLDGNMSFIDLQEYVDERYEDFASTVENLLWTFRYVGDELVAEYRSVNNQRNRLDFTLPTDRNNQSYSFYKDDEFLILLVYSPVYSNDIVIGYDELAFDFTAVPNSLLSPTSNILMINRNAFNYLKVDSEFLSNTDSGVTFSKGDYYYWIATIDEDLYFTSVKKGVNLLSPLNKISMHIFTTSILVFVIFMIIVLLYVVRFARKEMKTLEINQGVFKKAVTEAKIDYLTQIGNRRSAEESLYNYFKIFQKEGSVFPIILFDIDNFKYINDTYGHFAGDKVIISIVDELLNFIEEKAVLFRWGGDEFILLANSLAEDQAKTFAKEILKVISQIVIEIGEYKIKPTISLGISVFCSEDQYFLDAVERADQAMYQAKSSLGNRFQFNQKTDSSKI